MALFMEFLGFDQFDVDPLRKALGKGSSCCMLFVARLLLLFSQTLTPADVFENISLRPHLLTDVRDPLVLGDGFLWKDVVALLGEDVGMTWSYSETTFVMAEQEVFLMALSACKSSTDHSAIVLTAVKLDCDKTTGEIVGNTFVITSYLNLNAVHVFTVVDSRDHTIDGHNKGMVVASTPAM